MLFVSWLYPSQKYVKEFLARSGTKAWSRNVLRDREIEKARER